MARRFQIFEKDLPALCETIPTDIDELTFNDYSQFMSEWLRNNA